MVHIVSYYFQIFARIFRTVIVLVFLKCLRLEQRMFKICPLHSHSSDTTCMSYITYFVSLFCLRLKSKMLFIPMGGKCRNNLEGQFLIHPLEAVGNMKKWVLLAFFVCYCSLPVLTCNTASPT